MSRRSLARLPGGRQTRLSAGYRPASDAATTEAATGRRRHRATIPLATAPREGAAATGAPSAAIDHVSVVLVHGAYANSSTWDGVIERLLTVGVTVVAVPIPPRGRVHDDASVAEPFAPLRRQVPAVCVADAAVGTDSSNAANEVGRASVVALARARATLGSFEANEAGVHAPASHTAGPASGHGLTPREREVLNLLADGLSNREIAALLHLSGRTAENHVYRILDKLRLPSRAAAAAWTMRNGFS